MGRYIMNALIALDRLGNALLLGSPDETISARAGRWATRQDRGIKRRIGLFVCGFLGTIDPGHCEDARSTTDLGPERRVASAFPYRGRLSRTNANS